MLSFSLGIRVVGTLGTASSAAGLPKGVCLYAGTAEWMKLVWRLEGGERSFQALKRSSVQFKVTF